MTQERDLRDEFIQQTVAGHSFVDVGGLWRVTSEKLTVAHQCGATSVTMFDVAPKDDPDWLGLQERMAERNIDYTAVCGDFLTLPVKPFDVVHSAGMLYHMINPIEYLKRLRTITNRFAIITTAIVQDHIENAKGTFSVPPSGVLYMMALSEQERIVLEEYWKPWAEVTGVTNTRKCFNISDAGGWIWLPTANAFKKMTESCGFEVLNEGHYWYKNAYTLLVR